MVMKDIVLYELCKVVLDVLEKEKFLKENEVLNDLLGYDGLKIIQNPEMFNFSLDSTLLGDYATLNKNAKSIVDLCTGNAPVPLFLSLRSKNAQIIGVEIQDKSYDLATRNVAVNGLENRITIVQGDLKGIHEQIGKYAHDVVTCNPPYFKVNPDSNLNKNSFDQYLHVEFLLVSNQSKRSILKFYDRKLSQPCKFYLQLLCFVDVLHK